MPAFDPVRDAVLNSPLSPSPVFPPRLPRTQPAHPDNVPGPPLHRRATDLSVLLNTAAPPPSPPPPPPSSSSSYLPSRSSSLAHLLLPAAPAPNDDDNDDDKLARAPPLLRHRAGSIASIVSPPSPPDDGPDHASPFAYSHRVPAAAQAQPQPQPPPSPDALFTPVTDRSFFPPPPPSPYSTSASAHSLSRPSTSDDTPRRPSTSSSTPHRTPLSPHMPPPPPRPAPSQAPSAAPTPAPAPLPYEPHRRTPAGSVLVPLTQDEIAMYRSYVGTGTRRLAKRKRAASGSENSPAPDRPGRPADGPDGPFDDDAPRAKRSRDVALVADHYNSRPEVGVQQRRESPIIGLRKFNNWVKSVLITRFAHPALHAPAPGPTGPTSASAGGSGGGGGGAFAFGGRANAKVLDMGCGKGGDLSKWSKARVKEYVGVDIAAVSVDQARARYESMTSRPARGPRGGGSNSGNSSGNGGNGGFTAFFAACDCFADALTRAVPPERLATPFDAVSLQFCMHYAFESRAKARTMLDNAARWLRPGGVFVGTIPNAEQLLARLDALPPGAPPSFGNDVYRIRFEDGERARDKAARPVFGHKYWFFLRDAVEDVPEYIVHWEPFVQLAAEYGLHPVYKKEFHEVFEEHQGHAEFGPLLERMKVVDKDGESQMDEDQWEAANIYIAFALEKR